MKPDKYFLVVFYDNTKQVLPGIDIHDAMVKDGWVEGHVMKKYKRISKKKAEKYLK
jgi:hypothetical protein